MQIPRLSRGQIAVTTTIAILITAAFVILASTVGPATLMAYMPFGHSSSATSAATSSWASKAGSSKTVAVPGIKVGKHGTTTESMTGAGASLIKAGPVDHGIADVVSNPQLASRLTASCITQVSAALTPMMKQAVNQKVNLAATPATHSKDLAPKCLFLTTSGARIVIGSFTIKDPTKALAAGDAWSTWVTSLTPGGQGSCSSNTAVMSALGKNPWAMPDGGEFFQTHVSNCAAKNGDAVVVITRGLTVGYVEGPAAGALNPGEYAKALVAAIPGVAS